MKGASLLSERSFEEDKTTTNVQNKILDSWGKPSYFYLYAENCQRYFNLFLIIKCHVQFQINADVIMRYT